jgi:hypothetical protein
MREMFAQPITGSFSTLINSNIVVDTGPPDRCVGLIGNYQAKVLFEQADSDAKAETTVLQNRIHLIKRKFFDFLGTHIVPSVTSGSEHHDTIIRSCWEILQ